MVANKSGLQMSTVRNLAMAWVLTLAGRGAAVGHVVTGCSRTCSRRSRCPQVIAGLPAAWGFSKWPVHSGVCRKLPFGIGVKAQPQSLPRNRNVVIPEASTSAFRADLNFAFARAQLRHPANLNFASRMNLNVVIPAKAGIHFDPAQRNERLPGMDFVLRRKLTGSVAASASTRIHVSNVFTSPPESLDEHAGARVSDPSRRAAVRRHSRPGLGLSLRHRRQRRAA